MTTITLIMILLASYYLGWVTRWLTTKKSIDKMKEELSIQRKIIVEYDSAAKDFLKSARKPRPTYNETKG